MKSIEIARPLSFAIFTSVESLSTDDASKMRLDTFPFLCHLVRGSLIPSISQVVHGVLPIVKCLTDSYGLPPKKVVLSGFPLHGKSRTLFSICQRRSR